MADQLALTLPAALGKAAWDKAKGSIAKVHATGIGEALLKLKDADAAIDRDVFSIGKLTQLDVMVPRLALQLAQLRREIKAAGDQAGVVSKLAAKGRDDFKKGGPITKGAMNACAGVLAAADAYAADLKKQTEGIHAELQGLIDKAQEEARKAEKNKGGKNDKEDKEDKGGTLPSDPATQKALKLVKARTVPGLRTVKANNPQVPAPAFIAAIGPVSSMLMLNKSIGGTEKNLMIKLLPGQKGIKFFRGEVIWEMKAFTFVSANPVSGAAKKLQAALKLLTKANLKVRLRKPDGQAEEVGGDDDLDVLADDKPKLTADTGQQVKALTERIGAVKGDADKLIAQGDTLGTAAKKLMDLIKLTLANKQYAQAWAQLDRLDDLLAMAAPAGEDEQAATSGVVDEAGNEDAEEPAPGGPDPRLLDADIIKLLDEAGKLAAAVPGEDAAVKLVQQIGKLDAGRKLALALPTPARRVEGLAKLKPAAQKLKDEALALAQTVKARTELVQLLKPVSAGVKASDAIVKGIKEPTVQDNLAQRVKALNQEITTLGKAADPLAAKAQVPGLKAKADQLALDAASAKTFNDWVEATYWKDVEHTQAWIDSLAPDGAKTRVQDLFDKANADMQDLIKAMKLTEAQSTGTRLIDELYTLAVLLAKQHTEQGNALYRGELLLDGLGATAPQPLRDRHTALKDALGSTWPVGATASAMTAGVAAFGQQIAQLQADLEGVRATDVGTHADAKKLTLDKSLATFKKAADGLNSVQQKNAALGSLVDMQKDLAAALKLTDIKARGAALVALEKDIRLRLKELQKRALSEEMATPTGKDDIQRRIAAMGGSSNDPDELVLCEAAMEVRFGIKVQTPEDLKKKGLPRMFDLMCKVPEWQARQVSNATGKKALKELQYGTEPTGESNYFSPSRKLVSINVDESVTEKYIPDDASYDTVVTKTFDVTTLHEVGHAVDEKIGFMKNRMGDNAFGGWSTETLDSVLKALADDSGFVGRHSDGTKKATTDDLHALVRTVVLEKKASKPAKSSDDLGSLRDKWDDIMADPIIATCRVGMNVADEVWWGGKGKADKLKVGQRCYHEGYAGDWVSYHHGARAPTGVNFYQWRAPAEWFAEIYAMYYMGTLAKSHPMTPWFENEANSEAGAAAVPGGKK